jgi:uncharacterized 2Fe-2S/4Fe-4S cluster protein (DUF4445 family)
MDEFRTTNMFLDDIFSAFPALSDNHIKHGSQASPLAINVISCPLTHHHLAHHESTHCDVLTLDKAQAKGTPSEQL